MHNDIVCSMAQRQGADETIEGRTRIIILQRQAVTNHLKATGPAADARRDDDEHGSEV